MKVLSYSLKVAPEDRSVFNSGINKVFTKAITCKCLNSGKNIGFTPTERHFQRDNLFPELKDSVILVILGNIYVTLQNMLIFFMHRHIAKKANSSKL